MTEQKYTITPLTRPEARQILTWRYDAPYDFYDPPIASDIESMVDQFVNPKNDFHGIRDLQNRFVGFCSFGKDGQVLGGKYADGPLDLGLGMKPEETSRGRGIGFFCAIVQFAVDYYDPSCLRLSVATFNERAISVYRKSGFEKTAEFTEVPTATPYMIMEMTPNYD